MFDISVIIPTYNRCELLELTLKSIENQNNNELKFEVIIVDDGSTDDTKEMVDKYKERIKDLQYYYQLDVGFRAAKARNVGIEAAKGEVIAFVDSGMLLHVDYIYEHYKMHLQNKNHVVIGNVYGFAADTDDEAFIDLINLEDLTSSFDRLESASKYIDPRVESYKNFDFSIENTPVPYYYFWTCNISVRREHLIEHGGFDENFTSWGMEDVELGFRLYRKGLIFKINLDAKSIHYPHDSAIEAQEKIRSERDKENKLYFHNKYKCLESELLLTGAKNIFYNEDLLKISRVENKRFDFNKISRKCLPNFFGNDETILIVGSHNGSVITNTSNLKVLEYNKQYLESLKSKVGSNSVFNLFGSITQFENKVFSNVLITDFWMIYPFKWIVQLLLEASRIGRKIYIIKEITLDNVKICGDDEKKLIEYLKNSNKDYYEFTQEDEASNVKYICFF